VDRVNRRQAGDQARCVDGRGRELLSARPRFRYVERGHRRGENVYAALGRTRAGRRLIVFFVYKPRTREALVISARAERAGAQAV
jgi:uncharacterized DUF497 family protein